MYLPNAELFERGCENGEVRVFGKNRELLHRHVCTNQSDSRGRMSGFSPMRRTIADRSRAFTRQRVSQHQKRRSRSSECAATNRSIEGVDDFRS